MHRSRAAKVMAVLAVLCLALSLAMSLDMGAFGALAYAGDDLAFLVTSGYVLFLLAALLLWDRDDRRSDQGSSVRDGRGAADERNEEARSEQVR